MTVHLRLGRLRVVAVLATVLALVGSLGVTPGAATTTSPPLQFSPQQLDQALQCSGNLAGATRPPILLVPGTTLTPQANYSWNYERGFDALDWPWCSVTLPDNALGDTTVAAQYVVWAIRVMRWVSGQPVDILGYSQGGMLPRWALKYWPETRSFVQALVAIDPSNHGTLDANAICLAPCAPAIIEQQAGSHFLRALNDGEETWPQVNYTVIYSATDEIVPQVPVSGVSALPPGPNVVNVAVQSLCPLDLSEHLAMGTYDPVAYALVIDAFEHGGLAAANRIPSSVCGEVLAPDVDPAGFLVNYAQYVAAVVEGLVTSPMVSSEPPLPAYAAGS